MPMGGIYLTSSIVNACEFLLLEDETFKNFFIQEYLMSRGEGMSKYFKKMPLYIIR